MSELSLYYFVSWIVCLCDELVIEGDIGKVNMWMLKWIDV